MSEKVFKGLPVLPHDEYKVGDDVSEAIGGDCYYVGKVEKVSPSGKYLVADGKKYVKVLHYGRFKVDGEWIDAYKEGYKAVGGYCVLVPGKVEYRDPHF